MKKNTLTITFYAALAALLVAACSDDPDSLTGNRGRGGPGDPNAPGADPNAPADPEDPAQCTSKQYTGFDNAMLHGTRVVAKVGVDRGRMKPFSALQTEYARVLGAPPASLQGAAATFGQVPQRWYEEPLANAVALQTAYNIAFDGCLTFTATGADFEKAPDATSAPVQCGVMARKFWSKTPTPQEIQSCVDVATTGAASEPAARRKWAYACASILSSAGFMTY